MRKTIKIMSIVMILCMLFSTVSFASTGTKSEKITFRTIGIEVNGTEIAPCDVSGKSTEPFIRNADSSTYLPVRAVAGALGLDVGWDDATSTVILKSGGKVQTGNSKPAKTAKEIWADLTYRNIKITLDGKNVTLKNASGGTVEPFIKDGSTYIPVRAVAEALGCEVGWNGDTNTVILKNEKEEPAPVDPTPVVEPLKATGSINVTMPIEKTQAFKVSCSATGGTEPYTYQWYWGASTSNYFDMSTYSSLNTKSASLYATADTRYTVQYMKCKVTDKDGNSVFTNDIKIETKVEEETPSTPTTPETPSTPTVKKQTEPTVVVKDIPWTAAAVDSSGNPTTMDVTVKQYTFTFSTVPTTYDEIIQYKLDSPYKTMALAILAFRTWTPSNPTDCYEMMDYLTNTAVKNSTTGQVFKFSEYNYWTQFMKDRMMQNTKYRYIGNAYLKGATPANNYTPTMPVTITLRESTYVPYKKAEGNSPAIYQVLTKIDGADNERYALLYQHSNGDWKFYSDNWKGLLADVKTPAEDSLY